ncbi:MAG: hypothetical protein LBT30_05000 [Clostridiales bacterium]|jgi:hypothetical protein|nr:hypothetical protein [Clostridiales bacterium]
MSNVVKNEIKTFNVPLLGGLVDFLRLSRSDFYSVSLHYLCTVFDKGLFGYDLYQRIFDGAYVCIEVR